jgi:hypothetical protein
VAQRLRIARAHQCVCLQATAHRLQ